MRNAFRLECPEDIKEAIYRYVEYRLMPGSFLQAVLANSLEAAVLADEYNYPRLHGIHLYAMNYVPREARGSYDAVYDWTSNVGG